MFCTLFLYKCCVLTVRLYTFDGPNVLWCELKLPPRISEKYKSFTHYLKDSETGSNRLHGNMNGNSVENW